MCTTTSTLSSSNLGVVAAYGSHLARQKECEEKIANIQEQIIRRCAGESSCDLLRYLKAELTAAKESMEHHKKGVQETQGACGGDGVVLACGLGAKRCRHGELTANSYIGQV
jgi:hypothetical protein